MSDFMPPFSNAQIELLNLFAQPLSEEALLELKQLLLQFKFDQLERLANQEWETRTLQEADMEKRLQSHQRTPYKAQQNYLSGKNSGQ